MSGKISKFLFSVSLKNTLHNRMAAKKSSKTNKAGDNTIALNRQATHEYFIEEQII